MPLGRDRSPQAGRTRAGWGAGIGTGADALVRELLADLLHDAARHPVLGFDAARCRRLARVLRTDDAPARAVQAATAAALELARIDGPHRWAWAYWADKTASTDARRWHARRLVEQWTKEET